jgi:uncharacterized protein YqgV (UPF0045/DUF77 family)
MAENHTVTVSVQVVPLVGATGYAVVDQAIAAIKATGIKHIVTPMETVMEGTLDECLAAARAAHDAMFVAGTQSALTYIKISDSVTGSTIDDKLAKYRD